MKIEPVRGWATESEFEAYGECGILVCDEAFGEPDEIPVLLIRRTPEAIEAMREKVLGASMRSNRVEADAILTAIGITEEQS